MESLTEFMQGVKEGRIRGDYVQERIADNVLVELSVGPFQHGYINVRLIIDEARIQPEQGMYYRRLYSIDSVYEEYHQQIAELVEEENETPVTNAHEWEAEDPAKVQNAPFIPDDFNVDTTVFFSEYVQLRDDVTIIEALETNRAD